MACNVFYSKANSFWLLTRICAGKIGQRYSKPKKKSGLWTVTPHGKALGYPTGLGKPGRTHTMLFRVFHTAHNIAAIGGIICCSMIS
jgi:hypothetical protein